MSDEADQAAKRDAGKARYDLLQPRALAALVAVLTFGAAKYGAWSWRTVPNARSRYFAAAMRHTWAWWMGERCDPESGIHHLAHAACNLFFLMEADDETIDRS